MPFYYGKNVRLYYEDNGEGEPIVFTHGASWNHQLWDPQVEEFSKAYRVITWDVRGHGKSQDDGEPFTSKTFTEDLVGLLNYLRIDKVTLCGLSMGGIISMQTAIEHPARVKGLILIGAPCTFRFNRYERLVVPMQRMLSYVMPMRAFAKAQGYYFSRFNPANKSFIEEAVQSLTRKDWSQIWQALTEMDVQDDLKDISCPVLIIQGEQDYMIKHQQRYMAETIPNARWEIIKDANHATNRDNPSAVNALIDDFLR
ncbi:alpha/beta fold hydrolase [Alteribacter populi]|uniref:alpha/beta fold hydrolase n=1 Tax=Alteribacter populi TaxID=2011011 RepID=UPI000BBAB441|nr:alpha/beta hydrolase [Alteribacter populi]